MTEAEKIRNEDLRYGVRRICAERPGLLLTVSMVRRALSREFDNLTDTEVLTALNFIADLRQIKKVEKKLGASIYYQITAEGTLAHERGL